jgi:hypothetical protein
MKMSNFKKAVVVLAIIGVLGFAATSFAGWGRGGGGDCWGRGGGKDSRWSGFSGYPGELSDNEIDTLKQERQAFFEDTRELRERLYQKRLELRSEMAKQDPDVEKAVAIQKDVSDLKGQLAQKRIVHRIKMQKEHPQLFAGRGYGPGRGYGKGFGNGRGRGFQGRGGGCWY